MMRPLAMLRSSRSLAPGPLVRRRRSLALLRAALLLFLGTLVLVGPRLGTDALAQTPTIAEQLPEEARDDWRAALDLYKAGDYAAALVQFKRVYEISKNPRVLYNVSVCEKNLKNYAKAIATLEEELSYRDQLSPEDIERAEAAIEALEPYVSTLKVTASQPDAQILVAGEEVARTPMLESVPIAVGKQTITVRKPGYVEQSKTIEVARGTPAVLDFKLVPETESARVRVEVSGADGARVFIDGVDMGPAPFEGAVSAGRHTFEARADGFEPARRTDDVLANTPLELQLTMARSINEGKVKVVTGHADAVISIDGKVVGSGSWEGVLTAGGHQLVVTKDGYETYSADIALSADQVRTVDVELTADRGTSWVWWTVGTVAVVAGGGIASYFVFRPAESSEVTGTLNPGVVPTARW